MLYDVVRRCVLFVVCRLLSVACCVLCVVRHCLLRGACCLLFVVC